MVKAALISEEEFEAANRMAEASTAAKVTSARYIKSVDELSITLDRGYRVSFPVRNIQELHDTNRDDLAFIDISPFGTELIFPVADRFVDVTELLKGHLGTKAWMEKLSDEKVAMPASSAEERWFQNAWVVTDAFANVSADAAALIETFDTSEQALAAARRLLDAIKLDYPNDNRFNVILDSGIWGIKSATALVSELTNRRLELALVRGMLTEASHASDAEHPRKRKPVRVTVPGAERHKTTK